MAQRTFLQKLKNVNDWKTIADLHWERILGVYDNDKDWWNDLFHSMESEDWWDVVDVARALQIQHPEELRRYNRFDMHIDAVEKRLHKAQPVIKQWHRQGYNVAATALFMTVRDVLNEIAGTPTQRWTDEQRARILKERSERRVFDELFHTGD